MIHIVFIQLAFRAGVKTLNLEVPGTRVGLFTDDIYRHAIPPTDAPYGPRYKSTVTPS